MTVAEPTYLAPIPSGTDLTAAEIGAKLLGFDLFEQGLHVAGQILARNAQGEPLYRQVAVMIPRRGTKTTSIWCTLIGLCQQNPGFRVVHTAQNGSMAATKMREIMTLLQNNGHDDGDDGDGTVHLRWSNMKERIEFANGSVIWVVKPKASAFRSEAADVEFFDEAGELKPEDSLDLQAGALPLLDTRPMGQVIIAGTPAEEREGLLWDALGEGRAGKESCGIVDYSVRDDEEGVLVDEEGNATVVEEVLRRVHPGIGTLTTYERIVSRLEKMGRTLWEREYLCRFPFNSTVSALDVEAWEACSVEGKPAVPERLALGFDIAPDDTSAALCAAWRDEDGKAHVFLLEHRVGGSAWLPASAAKYAAKYNRAPVAHDTIGANQASAERMGRQRPAPRMMGRTIKQMMSAAQTFAAELRDGDMVHYGHGQLTAAVLGATWRDVNNSGRLFARKNSRADVSPLVAATVALHAYDEMPRKAGGMVMG